MHSRGDYMEKCSYKQGDHVEVWSNGKQIWMVDGVILEVAHEQLTVNGYVIPPSSVKVSSAAGIKWVTPDALASSLRAPAGAKRDSATSCAVGDEAGAHLLCKFGCGRRVQPGLTKGLRPFDTCCKRCARSQGKDGHDNNCGGMAVAAPAAQSCENLRSWLNDILKSGSRLKQHANCLFVKIVGSDQGVMPVSQMKEGVAQMFVDPFKVKIGVTDEQVREVIDEFGLESTGSIDLPTFRRVTKHVLQRMESRWFPPRLTVNTERFVKLNPAPLDNVYRLGKKLGEGSYGKVYEVTHIVSQERRVCKKIAKVKGAMEMTHIMSEIKSMAMLDHPNVIKVYEYFEDDESVSQIMEPCNGGELADKVNAVFREGAEAYNETFIVDVMKQTLRALAFMHGERFMHKDLKPQNIMMVEKDSSSVKVIDFGLAELFKHDQETSDKFGGTLLFMAPEVLRQELGMKADVWSAGVILYHTITGDFPFLATWPIPPGKDMNWWQQESVRQITNDPFKPHARLTDGSVSPLCVALMSQMLEKDTKTRPDAASCLDHPWFKQFEQPPPPLSVGVLQCLDAFAGECAFKKAVFLLIAHQFKTPAVEHLRSIFTHFDTQNRGTLSQESLRKFLLQSGMLGINVERVLYSLDGDDSGAIEWTEFLSAALCVSVCRNKQLVCGAFSIFDSDMDGKISIEDVLRTFAWDHADEDRKKRIFNEFGMMTQTSGTSYCDLEHFTQFVGQEMVVTSGALLSAVH